VAEGPRGREAAPGRDASSTVAKGLTPFLLLLPGSPGWRCSSSSPLGFLGYQSLERGSFDTRLHVRLGLLELLDALSTYHEQFVRSFVYAASRRCSRSSISYPLVYWIAFRAGRWKNVFLILIVRTAVRHVSRADARLAQHPRRRGPGRRVPADIQSSARTAAARDPVAVVAGITYNFLPFMALPLYVVARADRRAPARGGEDLYASKRQAFLRVTLPLSRPDRRPARCSRSFPARATSSTRSCSGRRSSTWSAT
jgi:spermidine/putrescine transport system permease protein